MVKHYRNQAEEEFAQEARKHGWAVTKRGYPDFICTRGDNIMFVEVKPKKCLKLYESQRRIMDMLRSYGIKCYKWTPKSNWFNDSHTLPS